MLICNKFLSNEDVTQSSKQESIMLRRHRGLGYCLNLTLDIKDVKGLIRTSDLSRASHSINHVLIKGGKDEV